MTNVCWYPVLADEWKMWKQMWDNYCVLTNLSSQPEFETYQYQTALLFHSMALDLMVSESSMACNYLMIQTAKSVVSIDILEKLGSHFFGERKEFFERFKFNRRNQESGENIDQYIIVFRTTSKSCGFCDSMKDKLLMESSSPETTR